jgi:hypothetical protein
MSDLRKQAIRLAAKLPAGSKERQALLDVLKVAGAMGLHKITSNKPMTISSGGVYAHVWLEDDNVKSDFRQIVKGSGELEVVVTTSEDPLNLNPRGRELARQYFRFAEPHARAYQFEKAEEFIRDSLIRYRNR